ncbi:hypothetical protein V8C42DRAFT_364244 [Trichoderma barbatum]
MNTPYGTGTSMLSTEKTALKAVMQTPFDSVYKLSPDGMTYLEPLMLREPEAVKKGETQKLVALNPSNKKLQDALKRYSDNSSKFKKIREVFGENSRYHPNQLIGKQYLPPGGLCQKEPMYRLACKISDLKHLYRTGELAMDPFDFIRWRVIKKAGSLLAKPGDSPKDFIRTVVYKLCDDSVASNAKIYQDSVMRQAVLLSAAQRNQLGNYGHKGKNRKNSGMRQTTLPYRGATPRQRSRLSIDDVVDNRPEAAPALTRPLAAERRARPAARPTIYAGVNAFRAQRQQQQRSQQRTSGN